MHKTRSEMPKEWPLPRKGTKYFIVGTHATDKGIPLVIALRDILKIVDTAKEARIMILNGEVRVNQQVRKNERFPVRLFDILSLEKAKKNYKLDIAGKRVQLKEVSAKESEKKTIKIVGKVLLAKDKLQMNLEDGSNFLVKEKFFVGDSAVIALKENKVEKIVPMKEGARVLIVSGRHSGKEGKIKEMASDASGKSYLVKFEEGEANLPLKTLQAIE